jgi:hypothetical protein
MDDPPRVADQRQVQVVSRGVRATWLLQVARRGRELILTLSAPQRTWTAVGGDVFGAMMDLREHLDAEEILLCCNGARGNAWASGMQRDMGEGFVVHLLDYDRPGKPPVVHTLDDAPCDQIVTVDEQKAFYSGWLARRSARGVSPTRAHPPLGAHRSCQASGETAM